MRCPHRSQTNESVASSRRRPIRSAHARQTATPRSGSSSESAAMAAQSGATHGTHSVALPSRLREKLVKVNSRSTREPAQEKRGTELRVGPAPDISAPNQMRRSAQLQLRFSRGRGGPREGAGRPAGDRRTVPHRTRPEHRRALPAARHDARAGRVAPAARRGARGRHPPRDRGVVSGSVPRRPLLDPSPITSTSSSKRTTKRRSRAACRGSTFVSRARSTARCARAAACGASGITGASCGRRARFATPSFTCS